MPEPIPALSIGEVLALKGAPYAETALLVAEAFLKDELPREALREIVEDSYNFDVPLERVSGRLYIMRLDRGPTASFKDFAARMMARLMSRMRDPGQRLNVLVGHLGRTGHAVGEAFKGVEGIGVTILYPRGEVSGMQKRQLDTIGGNVLALSVDGKFDDCQDLVKQAFSDPGLAHLNLTSANSINFGRILPQSVYYVYAYGRLAEPGEEIVFSVPSGNFGDALGCEYARRMGLPVRMLVMPTNENDEFPDYLRTGVYEKVSPSRACLSNAMNVGHPSNLARFFELYGGTVDRTGLVHAYPDIREMRKRIFSVTCRRGDERDHPAHLRAAPHTAEPRRRGLRGWSSTWSPARSRRLACVASRRHPASFPTNRRAAGDTSRVPQSRGPEKRTGEPSSFRRLRPLRAFLLDTLKGTD